MLLRARRLIGRLLVFLPSFLLFERAHTEHPSPRLHATSYLDGLRGLASLIVAVCHYTEDNHEYFIPSWGLGEKTSSILQFPFIRVIYSGRPMVHIFFIISGMVLSQKPIQAIYAHDIERCQSILASSAFRRPIRLFGPCIVSTFLVLVLSYAGYLYHPLPTLSEQFEDWGAALLHGITWPWSWDFDLAPAYDVHLWTVPIEFIHSMMLFMVVLVLSPMRRMIRLSGLLFIMLYCLACGRWAAFEFLGGCLITEMQFWQAAREPNLSKATEFVPSQRPSISSYVMTTIHVVLVMFWWFIAGWPNENAARTPGIMFFVDRTPEPFASVEVDERRPQKFWFCLSALGLIWTISQVRVLQGLLEGALVQHLGRMSYALYIVHGPILNLMQRGVMGHVGAPAEGTTERDDFVPGVAATGIKGLIGTESPSQQILAWILGLVVMGPIVAWAADVFWRAVDLPIMGAARLIEGWCSEK
ncbi:hypothetical protein BN1723_002143 [Verticillium longisporum]|uniref:Acyltransferase 3 domain-containing protein n=1 Tax=Verticillium longisporum TaxID=100787 RepID=A0A0G4KYX3_VERLO|nr:O-acetyltransferase PaAT-1 like protein [Verticillium longisporum]CRK14978.1 hypothetical protein BN1723_002143 [Verticillium longisporum]